MSLVKNEAKNEKENKMIIYIHGFGGSGEGNKARAFREYFRAKGVGFIAPTLSYNPELAIKTLDELIDSYKEDIFLIGASLGGFYTLYLSQKESVKKAVVINPSITPWSTLQRAVGYAPNFYDESCYKWCETHLETLKNYETKELEREKLFLLLQKGDELLNPEDALIKLEGCKMVVEEGGNHGFEGIERHFEEIEKFF